MKYSELVAKTMTTETYPKERVIELLEEVEEVQKKEILEMIDKSENPYPKDIFVWDNKEELNFNRGRFNRHCFEIVENIKNTLKKQIEEEK